MPPPAPAPPRTLPTLPPPFARIPPSPNVSNAFLSALLPHLLIALSHDCLSMASTEASDLAASIKRPVMVMKELRQTEQAYLDSLRFLGEHYIPQIRSVLPDMVERIFLGVERLIPLHHRSPTSPTAKP